ncbi:MAG: hypothetical protein M3142_14885 [Bacteroidota bacterium]|nr:hypothetical protein [Bacteroidota bacterium]
MMVAKKALPGKAVFSREATSLETGNKTGNLFDAGLSAAGAALKQFLGADKHCSLFNFALVFTGFFTFGLVRQASNTAVTGWFLESVTVCVCSVAAMLTELREISKTRLSKKPFISSVFMR